jgi:NAD(P)-dependent dehydrogenase (short-subunit alcohol dehydrogenase family)
MKEVLIMEGSNNSLDGKVAIVTGAGAGIGRETSKTLAEYGARVVVADISEKGGRETVDYVGSDAATFVAADVSNPTSMEQLVARTVELYGRLDIAHNNAGVDLVGPHLADVTPEQFQRVIDINLAGVFYSMKAEIPAMLQNGGGSIINTASSLGEVALAGQSAYIASKHGVIGLTKGAALEYSSRGIRVNAVLPGLIHTPMVDQIEADQPGFTDLLVREHPIGRLGTPRDIAEMVAWLASDAAAFATGASFAVDGGYLAH